MIGSGCWKNTWAYPAGASGRPAAPHGTRGGTYGKGRLYRYRAAQSNCRNTCHAAQHVAHTRNVRGSYQALPWQATQEPRGSHALPVGARAAFTFASKAASIPSPPRSCLVLRAHRSSACTIPSQFHHNLPYVTGRPAPPTTAPLPSLPSFIPAGDRNHAEDEEEVRQFPWCSLQAPHNHRMSIASIYNVEEGSSKIMT